MKAIFDQHIGVFENAFSKEWCNNLINVFEGYSSYHKSRKEADRGVDPIFKDDTSIFLNEIEKESKLCDDLNKIFFQNIYPLYAHKYKIERLFEFDLFVDKYKLQKTYPTEGYHVWHYESSHPSVFNRTMVYTLYLNDIEEGGETEFLLQSKRIKPTQGTFCLFPAGYTHIHRGNPPLSNPKYILTGWISAIPKQTPPPNIEP